MRARRFLAALGAVALATAGIVTTGSVTAAVAIAPANPAPVCTVIEAQPMVRCTVTYNYTGTEQVFTPPTGITRLQFELVGGRGGDAAALSTVGGQADKVRTADVSHAVQQFFVNVGGAGSSTEGGYNGGGAPGYIGGGASNRQGGGGGASDIRTVAGTEPGSLGSRIIVAGGGGGASAFLNGGNAGMPGALDPSYPGGSGEFGGGGYGWGTSGALGVGGAGGAYAPPGGCYRWWRRRRRPLRWRRRDE